MRGSADLLGLQRLTTLRVQSKDLLQSSAQKASSVSPAHFRSALAHARRLLKTVDLPALGASPPKRSSRASSSTTSPTKPDAPLASTDVAREAEETIAPAPNLFNTPRKKYKYSSGVDVSALIRNTPRSNHEPAMSSPLRHSVTPSKRPMSSPRDEAATPTGKTLEAIEEEAAAKAGDELRTPSKRVKYGTRPGVDLERVEVPPVILSARKKREDASAFFALRPGVAGTASGDLVQDGLGKTPSGRIPFEDGLPEVHTPTFRRKRQEGERKARVRRKRDWTYSESVWTRDTSANREVLEKVSCWR